MSAAEIIGSAKIEKSLKFQIAFCQTYNIKELPLPAAYN